MAIESYQTQLERVQAAIAELEVNSAELVTQSDRTVRYRQQQLNILYQREVYLRGKVAEEANGGADGPIRARGVVPCRS